MCVGIPKFLEWSHSWYQVVTARPDIDGPVPSQAMFELPNSLCYGQGCFYV